MKHLHSNVIGEGKQDLIILHGFLGMGDNWKSHAKYFASKGLKVHLIDQRNHGRSFWSNEFNYNLLVNDLLEYMNYNNILEPIIMGHSMGGKTAMQFSFIFSNRIKKLIIIDIAPKKYIPRHDKILKGLSELDFNIIKSRNEADYQLIKYVPELEVRQFLLKNLYWKTKDELALRFNISVLKDSSIEINNELFIKNSFIKPALFLKGEKSDYIKNEDLNLIEKYFPKSKIKTISNAGHWLHVENQKDFISEIMVFLNC